MNFGIVGFGKMGKIYYDVLTSMDINTSFVCDLIKPENNIKFYQDYKKAIDESNVDGVIVSTTAPSHYQIIIHAIENKIKYIVCEKPFTISVKQADEIINKLKKSDSRLTINYSRRHSEAYSSLKKNLFEENIIGEPRTVIITCGAGGLSAVGTHFLDLCTLILGDVKSVFASPVDKNFPNPRGKEFNDPGGYVLLNFEDGSRAYIDIGDDLGLQHIIEIVGEYGRITIDEPNKTMTVTSRSFKDRKKPKNLYGLPNPVIKNDSFVIGNLEHMITNMMKNLISESNLRVTAEMAKNKVEIYSAIRKSFDTNAIVELPLKDEYYEKEFMVT